ncbi:MAG: ASCH domain-containing protein [Thermodesulfobacteriota bacterium]
MEDKAVLISIHPGYTEKILSGEKRLEFRRSWVVRPVKYMVIYATSPIQRIVAVAEIKEVYSGTRARLWSLAMEKGGGISRRKLFSYLADSKNPVAIELTNIKQLESGLDPKDLFGSNFRPPQSFCYLKEDVLSQITEIL